MAGHDCMLVQIGEYFGGFDGYFSVDPADGHENCFNSAVSKMFQQVCRLPGHALTACIASVNCTLAPSQTVALMALSSL